jgi:hypothetical protein
VNVLGLRDWQRWGFCWQHCQTQAVKHRVPMIREENDLNVVLIALLVQVHRRQKLIEFRQVLPIGHVPVITGTIGYTTKIQRLANVSGLLGNLADAYPRKVDFHLDGQALRFQSNSQRNFVCT